MFAPLPAVARSAKAGPAVARSAKAGPAVALAKAGFSNIRRLGRPGYGESSNHFHLIFQHKLSAFAATRISYGVFS